MRSARKTIQIQTLYGPHDCILEPDEKKGFIATAPGLPGVITWGKDIAQAKKMAKEAIELCIECLAEERLSKRKHLGRAVEHVAA
ncbi:MAG: hypothetical protein UY22_C0046G0004 [Candidatus Amesbacteria bacterium GW2011_GWC1_48_10]|uniref:HicB-like antitoxin of toxin-antitoxin system domain-containing protein n=1 Tax=Candidatus Amesbacteria bacterium GW2011_GWC1_48_10 TaxID=1618365 RepID=A0A0G1WLC9_9BACT|nr:MAG: hypothetical protein UY22_C0046G0004 [Candidatus Amesbacteria bacterium GW2011_GWC1_48_10]